MRKLDRERRQRGIRQDVLCRDIGISTKTYAALLRGECNRLDVFLKIERRIKREELNSTMYVNN